MLSKNIHVYMCINNGNGDLSQHSSSMVMYSVCYHRISTSSYGMFLLCVKTKPNHWNQYHVRSAVASIAAAVAKKQNRISMSLYNMFLHEVHCAGITVHSTALQYLIYFHTYPCKSTHINSPISEKPILWHNRSRNFWRRRVFNLRIRWQKWEPR